MRFDDIFNLLDGGHDHAGEFHFADAQRAALPRRAHPAKKETQQLPQGIEPETAGHDRIALEVAGKKPQIGLNVEFGDNLPLAVLAALFRDMVMRSNISIGGRGSCALPGPNNSPRAQASRSSKSYFAFFKTIQPRSVHPECTAAPRYTIHRSRIGPFKAPSPPASYMQSPAVCQIRFACGS